MPHTHEAPTTVAGEAGCSLTAGAIAMINLQAQIDGLEQLVAGGRAAISVQVELIELITLRGQVLGRIGDYEWADERAEQLTRDAPADGMAIVARARARARFHRFAGCVGRPRCWRSAGLGADPALVDAERAGVFQAIGRYEAALTIYNEAAKRRADVTVLGALATLHAERGEIAAAEQLFDESSWSRYRGVSPFPLALLDFQRGPHVAGAGRPPPSSHLVRGRNRFVACRPMRRRRAHPGRSRGRPGRTWRPRSLRLLPLTASSDDPDYTASLSRRCILGDAGRAEEAAEWRNKTAARYDELMARHPEAFADHAAEFWLDAGDAVRARPFAQMNLEVRQTPRAHELLARAAAIGSVAPPSPINP